MKIAIGGFQHETNTFAPSKATFDLFERADGWPGLQRGAALLDSLAGINLGAAGFIKAAGEGQHTLAPLLWCSASPSAHVTENAFERIAAMLVNDLAAALPVDGVYLDLHGAMVAEHLEDGEGEILRRVRALIGPGMPLVASLDLHANVTQKMVDHADLLVIFRTYPHIDMAETGARACRLLERIRREGKPAKAFRQIPFLIPLTFQCTMIEPAQGIYRRLAAMETAGVMSLSFAPGFPPADIHDCGPAVVAYGQDQQTADAAADGLARLIESHAADFSGKHWQPDAAVLEAMRIAGQAGRPVIIADTQDNPGAGGNGDTNGMLAALIANRADRAVFGLLCDAQASAAAHAAGEGATIATTLGARSGMAGHTPLAVRATVEKLSDGRFTATGPMYGGNRMELGPMALLRLQDGGGGIQVVTSSKKCQAADQVMFRHLGVALEQAKVIVLKSSVHFRADFQPLAEAVLVAVAPGPNIVDPSELAYKNLRPGIRLKP